MAEFLIYNKVHWMSELSQQDVEVYIKKYPKFLEKYDARDQTGDVVEVRPDGYWTGAKAKAYNKSAFLVVAVPGLPFKDAKYYGEPLYGEEVSEQVWDEVDKELKTVSHTPILRKRKYKFNNVTDKQLFNSISEILVTEKTIG